MAVHWGGRGPGHMSRKSATGRSWADFTDTTGWVESPDNTFTRNTADSWTPRVTSNSLFTGAVKVEGTSGFVAATNVRFGLDPTPLTSLSYSAAYAWYFSPTATTMTIGNPRVAVGGQLAGDTYGVRKYWDGSQWMVEWYRIRSGVTTVHDSVALGSDVALGVLAGALNNGAFVTLSGLSA